MRVHLKLIDFLVVLRQLDRQRRTKPITECV